MPSKGSIPTVCSSCGQTFLIRPFRVGIARFCSKMCQNESQRRATARNCQICGASFTPYPSEIRKRGGKFCGRPCYIASRTIPLTDRFWSHVNKDGPIPEHRPELGPCWVWTARLDDYGRGVLGAGGSGATKLRASRVSWEIHYAALDSDVLVLHRCDNPACVRPDHLFVGAQVDNMRDMIEKGRAWWQQKHHG